MIFNFRYRESVNVMIAFSMVLCRAHNTELAKISASIDGRR